MRAEAERNDPPLLAKTRGKHGASALLRDDAFVLVSTDAALLHVPRRCSGELHAAEGRTIPTVCEPRALTTRRSHELRVPDTELLEIGPVARCIVVERPQPIFEFRHRGRVLLGRRHVVGPDERLVGHAL